MKPTNQHKSKAATSSQRSHRHPFAWLKCALVFALLWTLLTQGDTRSWIIGMVAVPLATWCAIRLFPAQHKPEDNAYQSVRISALFQFIPFFLEQSLRGGWESALFALHPNKRLYSGFICYTMSLPPGRPQFFFMNIVSLLPGTLSVEWKHNALTIHALDTRADNHHTLQQCETRVAALFGLNLISAVPESTKVEIGESI